MSERLIKVLDKLSHDLSIAELQQAHKTRHGRDLTYHDTLYLNIILAHPNRYTSSQIADLLKVTRPAVTQKINELAKKGYIIRTQSETDKRVFYLSVNPEQSIYTEEDQAIEQKVAMQMEATYGPEQVDKLCDMLEFLSEAMFNEKMKEQDDET